MRQHRQRNRGRRPNRRGTALVEMALVAPLFLFFILGIVEFGRAMMISQLVTNAARDGARVAATVGSTNGSVEAAVEEFLEDSLGLEASDVDVSITVSAGDGNPDPGNNVANAQPGDKCMVTVNVPFNKLTLTKPNFLEDKSLIGYCAMRREW